MAGETYITTVGRLTADPELRFAPSGDAVANFTIASNPRHFDKQQNQWVDGTPTFWRCEAWSTGKLTLAENIAESLRKGSPVIAYGEIRSREYQDREGNTRTSTSVKVHAIGPDLSWGAAPQQSRNTTPATPASSTDDTGWGAWGNTN